MELDTNAMLEDREERLKNLRKSNATQLGWIIVLVFVIAGLVIALIVTNINNEKKFEVTCNGIEQTESSTYINITVLTSQKFFASEFAIKVGSSPMRSAEYIVEGNTASFEQFGKGTYKVRFEKQTILPGDIVQLYFRGELIATL